MEGLCTNKANYSSGMININTCIQISLHVIILFCICVYFSQMDHAHISNSVE